MKAALVAFVLAACGGSQQSPPPPVSNSVPAPPPDAAIDAPPTGIAAAFAKLNEFSDAMCKCQDRACADRITQEMTAWGQEMARSAERPERVSDEDSKRLADITERMTQCMSAIYTKAAGSGSAP
jgi:hypothetical protein